MRLRDLKDAIEGVKRRNKELEQALRFCLRECEKVDMGHSVGSIHAQAIDRIYDEIEKTLQGS